MPIKFKCPHCDHALTVKDESLAGKKSPCPKCKKAVVIPRSVPSMAAAAPTRPADMPTGPILPPPSATRARTLGPTLTPGSAVATPATAADPLPELAGHSRYRLLRQIGQGGMGAVYLAEHLIMGRQVALKFVQTGLFASADGLARLRQEVRAAARLSHENIVAAYDADEVNGVHFLVMEFIEGVTLADAVAGRGPLPIAEACDYARQAALGLQHAHEKGMVHRDIKPANLMLTPGGRVKVLDFGLARFAQEQGAGGNPALTGSGVVMGTADYIAPEQTRGGRAVDIRADIYSLGCTLYHLLTGRVPFPEGTVIDKMIHHALDTPAALATLRTELPPALVAVVERMLAKDPAARFQTPAEVAERLAPFAGGAAPVVEEVYILPDIEVDVPTRPLASVTEKTVSARRTRESARSRRKAEERRAESDPSRARPTVTIAVLAVLSLVVGFFTGTAAGGIAFCFFFKPLAWVTLAFGIVGLGLGAAALYLGLRARPRRGALPISGIVLNLFAVGVVGASSFIDPYKETPPTFHDGPPQPVLEAKTADNLQVRVVSVQMDRPKLPENAGTKQQIMIRLQVVNLDKEQAVPWKGLESFSPSLSDDQRHTYTFIPAEGAPPPADQKIAAGGNVEETIRFGATDGRSIGNLSLLFKKWKLAIGPSPVMLPIPRGMVVMQ